MSSPPHERLTRREREIMDALFALEEGASAEDVRERLTDPPGYSAVRAMLVGSKPRASCGIAKRDCATCTLLRSHGRPPGAVRSTNWCGCFSADPPATR